MSKTRKNYMLGSDEFDKASAAFTRKERMLIDQYKKQLGRLNEIAIEFNIIIDVDNAIDSNLKGRDLTAIQAKQLMASIYNMGKVAATFAKAKSDGIFSVGDFSIEDERKTLDASLLVFLNAAIEDKTIVRERHTLFMSQIDRNCDAIHSLEQSISENIAEIVHRANSLNENVELSYTVLEDHGYSYQTPTSKDAKEYEKIIKDLMSKIARSARKTKKDSKKNPELLVQESQLELDNHIKELNAALAKTLGVGAKENKSTATSSPSQYPGTYSQSGRNKKSPQAPQADIRSPVLI
jgi:hypothetical protein